MSRSKSIHITIRSSIIVGALQIIACLLIYHMKVPNPNTILFVLLSAVLTAYGYIQGIVCGVVTLIYSMFFFSTNHSYIYYDTLNLKKVIIIFIGIIANIILIGHLKLKSDKMVAQNAQLEIKNAALTKIREQEQKIEKQKEILEEALEDLKQADYERRTDFLTGLNNRQAMFELIRDTLSGKKEKITSLYMMDIDNFKSLNDNYGHKAGDECLRKIGTALIKYGEENNMIFYRYGGEELLGVTFDNAKEASQIAQELVSLISDLNITRKDTQYKVVTVSLGYTSDNHRYEKMIDKADIAMYAAKENGKNQAVCFEAMCDCSKVKRY